MKPAAEEFENVLNEIRIQDANIPVIANVTARCDYGCVQKLKKLIEQLYSPVFWEDSIE